MSLIDLSRQIAIGIDIGGTNTKFGLVNHRGEILAKGSIKTEEYREVQDFIDALHANIQPLIDKVSKNTTLDGIGVVAPNANYYTGTIELAPNLPWKGVVHFAELMTKKFGVPCKMTNDANAAALGEMMFGAARGMKDFIMITIGRRWKRHRSQRKSDIRSRRICRRTGTHGCKTRRKKTLEHRFRR